MRLRLHHRSSRAVEHDTEQIHVHPVELTSCDGQRPTVHASAVDDEQHAVDKRKERYGVWIADRRGIDQHDARSFTDGVEEGIHSGVARYIAADRTPAGQHADVAHPVSHLQRARRPRRVRR